MLPHTAALRVLSPIVLLGVMSVSSVFGQTVSGGFEGFNVMDIVETSPNNFTCRLVTPPMPVPESVRYDTPGDHYRNWFMLKIADAAGQTVSVTITDIGWATYFKAFYAEVGVPHVLLAGQAWQTIWDASFSGFEFTFTLTPSTDVVWVALGYPTLPSHTDNWVAAQSASAYVTAETVLTTTQGRPLHMLFVTDPAFPDDDKRSIVIYGQEHMNVQTGGRTCQGAVEFLTSGDPVAQSLLEHVVFVIIPDLDPDATAAGMNCDPDDCKTPQWRHNPAAIDRMMPGMLAPMTAESRAIWNRLVSFVDHGDRIDFLVALLTQPPAIARTAPFASSA